MSAVTADVPRSARETIFGDTQTGLLQQDIDLNAIRYFVQMGWDVLSVDTLAIPNKQMIRGEITPCRTSHKRNNIYAIREGDRIPGSEAADKDGKVVWASERIFAHHEAENLLYLENASERQTGLVEVKALFGMIGNEVYRAINLNTLFWAEWPFLPESHEQTIDYLRRRIEDLKVRRPSKLPDSHLEIVYKVGDELIDAIKTADRIQKHLITVTHSLMKLRPEDVGYKKKYDPTDYEMLRRTGIPEVHSAEVNTAKALDKLADGRTGDRGDLAAILANQQKQFDLLSKQQDQQAQLLNLMFEQWKASSTPAVVIESAPTPPPAPSKSK